MGAPGRAGASVYARAREDASPTRIWHMAGLAVVDLGSNSFRLVVFTGRPTTGGSAPTRSTSRCASARAWTRPARWARPDGARAGDDRGLRALLPASGIEPADGRTRSRRRRDPRRGQLRGSSSSARAGGQRAARPRALRRGGGALRLPRGGQLDRRCADGVVLDLGGGSMQLVRVDGRHARELDSWRLGAVRMTERFLPGDGPAKPKQINALREHVAAQARARAVAGPRGARLVGIGGTVRNLARRRAARPRACPSSASRASSSRATRSTTSSTSWPRAAPCRARDAPRHQARARRPHPRRRARRADGDGGRRLRRARGDRGRPARGRLLRAPRSTATRRCSTTCAARALLNLAAQYGSTRSTPRTRTTSRGWRSGCSTSSPPRACTPATRSSASCCGRPRCCTTSAIAVDYDDHHKHSRYLILNAGLPGFSRARSR